MTKSCVKQFKGAPTLFIDEEPVVPLLFHVSLSDHLDRKHLTPHGTAGLHLYRAGHLLKQEGWPEPGEKAGYRTLDIGLQKLAEFDPLGRLLLVVAVDPPTSWLEAHPDDVSVYDARLDSDGLGRYVKLGYKPHRMREEQSFASKTWLEDALKHLGALVDHVESGPGGDIVFGYQVAAGWGTEWIYWGTFENRFGDYSRPMTQAFQAWLRSRYREDVRALRSSWKDPRVTFEVAHVPTKEERMRRDLYGFRDPAQSAKVPDYYEFISELMADNLLGCAQVVKKATGRQKICGAFYGYLAYGGMFPFTFQHAGHRSLERILHSPDVDFLASPYSYNDRSVGGDNAFMSVVGSVKLHGKLWFNEDDSRTVLSPPEGAPALRPFGQATTLDDTVSVLRRNFANVLTHRVGQWWAYNRLLRPVGENLQSEQTEVLKNIEKMREVYEMSLSGDWGYPSEVAVILDDKTPIYQSLGDSLNRPLITKLISRELGRIGAPYEMYLLEDLADPSMPDHKLYVFLNTFRVTEKEKSVVKEKTRRNGAVCVWIYAPGFISDEGLSEESMRDLTGISLRCDEIESDLHIRIIDYEHPATRGLPKGTRFGTDEYVGPVFYAEDPEAATLGVLTYRHNMDRPGFCVKEFERWRSVFVAAPGIPSSVLRHLAMYAGVHVYSESDDVLYADRRFLAIHTSYSGKRTFLLFQPSDVYDVFGDNLVARKATSFTEDLDRNTTRLYYLGDWKA
jgi:hypothetical protein